MAGTTNADEPSAGWDSVAPANMTFEQLQAARRAVGDALEATQNQLTWLNSAALQLSAEISDRFGMPVPGVPPRDSLANYPSAYVAEFDWSAPPVPVINASVDEANPQE